MKASRWVCAVIVLCSLSLPCPIAADIDVASVFRAQERPKEFERAIPSRIRRLPSVEPATLGQVGHAITPSVSRAEDAVMQAQHTQVDDSNVTPILPIESSVESSDSFANGVENAFVYEDSGAVLGSGVQAGVRFEGDDRDLRVGNNFYSPSDDFDEGIVIRGRDLAMKVSGYVKVDLIQDFDPIDSTDLFNTTTIPVGAPPRENSRFHARQSRLNFDTRWPSDWGRVRVFVEGDFFSEGDRFRMRHAYGEVRRLIIGQTWTTFTDMESLPNTLDMEGASSSISRRQAQVRWTQPLSDAWSIAVALEDARMILEAPEREEDQVEGDARTQTPDFIARLRFSPEWGQFQIAGLARELGFQPEGLPTLTELAWGVNFTGSILVTDSDEIYHQIVVGDGMGSYRDLPDAVPSLRGGAILGTFGWMVGWTHNWTESLSSNFTYSEASIDSLPIQSPDSLHSVSYTAVNLIWNPVQRMFMGIEYLYGTRENLDGADGKANRLQASFGFYLP